MAKAKAAPKPRQLPKPGYKSFRLSKRIKHVSHQRLPSVWALLKQSTKTIRSDWRLFGGIWLVYLILSLMVIGAGQGYDISAIKDELGATTGADAIIQSANIFQYILTADSTAGSESGGVYQFLLVLIVSLATIWALRHVLSGKKTTAKQSFYQGMYPLVPFMLVIFVMVIQLLPMLTGQFLYSQAILGGLAIEPLEQAMWILLATLLSILTIYMLASSVFALYIATLPEMTPMVALRSARSLVLHRRLTVLRKIVVLPVILVLLMAVIVVPLIIAVPWLAEIVFVGLTMAGLIFIHSYMYQLYREML